MKKNISALLLFLFISGVNAQGPWTREKRKCYIQLGLTSLSYNSAVRDGKEFKNLDDYSDITTQIYAEYGLSKNIEILGILPYKTVNVKQNNTNNKTSISGIGNLSLGLKYKLIDKNWKLSSGVNFSANSIKINSNENLSTGINSSTIFTYLTIGTSKNKMYYYGNIGYGYMNNNYSDFIKVNLEIGYEIIQKGHIIFVIDSRNIVSQESAFLNDRAQWFSHQDRQAYQAFGLKANYEITKDKFGANLAFFGASGIKNAPLAPTLNFGLYIKM